MLDVTKDSKHITNMYLAWYRVVPTHGRHRLVNLCNFSNNKIFITSSKLVWAIESVEVH